MKTRVFVAMTEKERALLKEVLVRGGARIMEEFEHDPTPKKMNDQFEVTLRALIKRVTDAELRCPVRKGELTLDGRVVPS